MLGTFVYVMLSLQNAKTSIKRFQRMLFGHRTEHKRNVLERAAAADDSRVPDASPSRCRPTAGHGAGAQARARRPGHGRNAAQAYSGAPIVECEHPELEPGDRCPQCDKGKVYDSPPKSLVKVVGQAPLGATVYKVQRLRCRLCDAIFTAPLPAAVASLPKYDSSCASMIAMLRYGNGMPHFRLEGLQASLYIPLPDATQWDIVVQGRAAPRAVFEELIRQAAQAPLLHSDDTPMKVLSLMAERERAEAGGVKPVAKAINTSGIVAVLQDDEQQRKVVLFFTGHAHAGKNMERVLAHRAQELAAGDADVRRAGGQRRRRVHHHPGQLPGPWAAPGGRCRRAIPRGRPPRHRGPGRGLQARCARAARTSCRPSSACRSTRQHSKPIMEDLHTLDDRAVRAAPGRTQFRPGQGAALPAQALGASSRCSCARPARPLDNNLCEQVLKRAILHRKGSMFYKTVTGRRGRRHLHEPDPHLPAVRCQPVRVSERAAAATPRT